MEPTDAKLLAAHLGGDPEAFAGLVRRYADLIYATALRRVRTPATADDVTQAVFMILARKARTLSGRATIGGWLLIATRQVAMTANRAAARRARHERRAARPDAVESPMSGVASIEAFVEASAEAADVAAVLDDAVLTLRADERDAITLRYFQNQSLSAVGQVLGISEDAARKRVDRALDKLRRLLTRRGIAVPAGGIAEIAAASAATPAPAAVLSHAIGAPTAAFSALAKGTVTMITIKFILAAAASVALFGVIGTVVAVAAMPNAPTVPASPSPAVQPIAKAPTASIPATAPSNWATGRVVRADGSPVEGAFVNFSTRDPKTGDPIVAGVGRSDAIGQYQIALPEGVTSAGVWADLPGTGFSSTQGWTAGKPVNFTFVAAGDARFILKQSDGTPAVGVRVWPRVVQLGGVGPIEEMMQKIIYGGDELLKRWGGVSDATGEVVIHGFPTGGNVGFKLDDPRFAQLSGIGSEQIPVEAAIGGPVKTIRLYAAAKIEGQLIYPDSGKPLVGERVYAGTLDRAMAEQSGGSAVTDDQGHFTINALKPGTFLVILGDSRKPDEWCAAATTVDLAEGDHKGANLKLIHGGVITGQVRSTATHRGLAGVQVAAYSPAHPEEQGSVQVATASADGLYTLRVPPGQAKIYLCSQLAGFQVPSIGTPERLQPVDVVDGQTVKIDFDLSPDVTPLVTGTVVDAAGKPVAGAVVSWEKNEPGGLQQTTQTDASGNFQIAVATKTSLRVRAGKLATLAAVAVPKNGTGVTIHVGEAAQFDLGVTVLDDAGAPLPDAKVSMGVMNGQFGTGGSERPVDPHGAIHFEDLYRDSNYFVEASAAGFGPMQKNVKPPKGGAASQQMTLKLVRANQTIAGIVVDGDGTPVADTAISLNGALTGVQQKRTDAAGRFSFSVVAKASGTLFFSETPRSGQFQPVEAKAGQTDLRVVLSPEEIGK